MRKDYYAILGVSRDADRDEIKRAFRRLARDTHPDANPGDAAAEGRFREIAEAYEVLSDPDRRRAYDHGETVDLSDLLMGGFDDLLRSVFGSSGVFGFGSQRRQARGRDIAVDAHIELAEAAFGTKVDLTFRAAATCAACGGSGAVPGTGIELCPRCHGTGSIQVTRRSLFGNMLTLATCDRCGGSGQVITQACSVCSGRGTVQEERTVTVEIPPGVSDGSRLRLAGQGEAGQNGAPSGDLYVEIRVEPDPRFTRDGDDLIYRLPIGVAQATLGTTASIPLLDGSETKLEIPAGTQPGQRFTISGQGMGRLGRRGRGDLHVVVTVVVPKKLSKEEEHAFRTYADLRGEQTRHKRRFR